MVSCRPLSVVNPALNLIKIGGLYEGNRQVQTVSCKFVNGRLVDIQKMGQVINIQPIPNAIFQ